MTDAYVAPLHDDQKQAQAQKRAMSERQSASKAAASPSAAAAPAPASSSYAAGIPVVARTGCPYVVNVMAPDSDQALLLLPEESEVKSIALPSQPQGERKQQSPQQPSRSEMKQSEKKDRQEEQEKPRRPRHWLVQPVQRGVSTGAEASASDIAFKRKAKQAEQAKEMNAQETAESFGRRMYGSSDAATSAVEQRREQELSKQMEQVQISQPVERSEKKQPEQSSPQSSTKELKSQPVQPSTAAQADGMQAKREELTRRQGAKSESPPNRAEPSADDTMPQGMNPRSPLQEGLTAPVVQSMEHDATGNPSVVYPFGRPSASRILAGAHIIDSPAETASAEAHDSPKMITRPHPGDTMSTRQKEEVIASTIPWESTREGRGLSSFLRAIRYKINAVWRTGSPRAPPVPIHSEPTTLPASAPRPSAPLKASAATPERRAATAGSSEVKSLSVQTQAESDRKKKVEFEEELLCAP